MLKLNEDYQLNNTPDALRAKINNRIDQSLLTISAVFNKTKQFTTLPSLIAKMENSKKNNHELSNHVKFWMKPTGKDSIRLFFHNRGPTTANFKILEKNRAFIIENHIASDCKLVVRKISRINASGTELWEDSKSYFSKLSWNNPGNNPDTDTLSQNGK
jgi:hypothetical protein